MKKNPTTQDQFNVYERKGQLVLALNSEKRMAVRPRSGLASFGDVGLSMMCYKEEKESKTCLGERQLRGRIGKELY